MSERETELARDLGFLEAYTLGLGTMIGAGIFVLPRIVAESAGPASRRARERSSRRGANSGRRERSDRC